MRSLWDFRQLGVEYKMNPLLQTMFSGYAFSQVVSVLLHTVKYTDDTSARVR